MSRTIAAAVAALALVSFGVRADEPAKADTALNFLPPGTRRSALRALA